MADFGEDVKGLVQDTASELKQNLEIIREINKDLREHYCANRTTLTTDEKRRIGTYLKAGMDMQMKTLVDLLMNLRKKMGDNPQSIPEEVKEALPAGELDGMIEALSPYERERMRGALLEGPSNGQ